MREREREREVEKLRGSLKVKSAVLPAFSVSTRADSLLESGEMIFRARFIQIFVQLDGSFDDPPLLLLLLLLFLLSKVSSFVASLRVSYFFNLLSFLFFPFFSRSPLVEHGEKVCGEHKGSVHVRRARKRQNLPRESRREESVGGDKDDHKGDKDCLFGPADNWAAVGQCLFFCSPFPFPASFHLLHPRVFYSDFYLLFFLPLLLPFNFAKKLPLRSLRVPLTVFPTSSIFIFFFFQDLRI